MEDAFDLAVIGSGPGGEVGAIRAAQLGLKVALIEKNEHLGGTCLNVGCIPTKALIESAKTWDKIQHLDKLGFSVENARYDWAQIMARKEEIVNAQRKGLRFLMTKNKIEVIQGTGSLADANHVAIEGAKPRKIRAAHILLATGSQVKELPFARSNGKNIHSSDSILFCKKPFKSLVIIGGGVVGMEFASLFGRFGAEVTVIELLEQIIPTEDPDCANELVKQLKKQNVTVVTGARLTGVEDLGTHCVVKVDKQPDRTCEAVLMSVGREPVLSGLNLDKVGVKTERGFVKVDAHYRTSVNNIYAIGDIIQTAALAHTASAEAFHAVEVIAGHSPSPINYLTNPSAIYTYPEVASIGKTEPQLKREGIEYKASQFPFAPLAKAKIEDIREGFIKILIDPKYGELLGVHIINARATELISEFALGKNLETTIQEIMHTIHPHPTISETIQEAAHAAFDRPIHL